MDFKCPKYQQCRMRRQEFGENFNCGICRERKGRVSLYGTGPETGEEMKGDPIGAPATEPKAVSEPKQYKCLKCGNEISERTAHGSGMCPSCRMKEWRKTGLVKPPGQKKVVSVRHGGNGRSKGIVARTKIDESSPAKIQIFFAKVEGSEEIVLSALKTIQERIAP